MYTYIPSCLSLPPSPIPPLKGITEHRAELPVPYSSFPLAGLHMVVYVCKDFYSEQEGFLWWSSG